MLEWLMELFGYVPKREFDTQHELLSELVVRHEADMKRLVQEVVTFCARAERPARMAMKHSLT
jgi:hypothetical protein